MNNSTKQIKKLNFIKITTFQFFKLIFLIMAHSRIILFLILALVCQFATAQTSNDNLPDLSLSVYSGLASG